MAKRSMCSHSWIGLDIGGANIKIAICHAPSRLDSSASPVESQSIPFALWKQPELLATELAACFAPFCGQRLGIAITMTGELADCYANRQVGVTSIVDSVTEAIQRVFVVKPQWSGSLEPDVSIPQLVFYGMRETGEYPAGRNHDWHDVESAKTNWTSVAAANWHAIASCVPIISKADTTLNGFLIDMGSTTTDIIPIRDGLPAATGLTDLTRLQSGELLYAGVARTPICSLVQSLMIGFRPTTIAREFFATIEDAFLILGEVAENDIRTDTADGRPFTRCNSLQRLAKMVGSDAAAAGSAEAEADDPRKQLLVESELVSIAQQVIAALRTELLDALKRVIDANSDLPIRFFLSGQGEWFVHKMLSESLGSMEIYRIADQLGEKDSQAMGAVAVASLAAAELPIIKSKTSPRRYRAERLRVIKIGGSLLDWPAAPQEIHRWLSHQEPAFKNIWMVGGGKMADAVRDFHASFPLNDSVSHWLALDAMSLNLRMIKHWFPDWQVHYEWASVQNCFEHMDCKNVWFDFSAWLKGECDLARALPETWDITSDSCAAFLAQKIGATDLVLLKSCPVAPELPYSKLAELGVVDAHFLDYANSIEHVQLINLRS